MELERFNRVFDILVRVAGANERQRDDFVFNHCRSKDPCGEYRFGGFLGHGGKYYRQNNRVSCYAEDETPARRRIVDETNAALTTASPHE